MGKTNKAGKRERKHQDIKEENLECGIGIIGANPLFSRMGGCLHKRNTRYMGKESAAVVTKSGQIYVNADYLLTPGQWAYVIAHCQLHLAFGHFDKDKMPLMYDCRIWNAACDIFIAKFLADIKLGEPTCQSPVQAFGGCLTDEKKIYEYLTEKREMPGKPKGQGESGWANIYGTAAPFEMDMKGLESPVSYDKSKNEYNHYSAQFAYALSNAVTDTVGKAGGCLEMERMTGARKAAQWFINHYPLLGSLAASFTIVEDYSYCMREEIQIAAVDVQMGEIYVNPAARLDDEEMKFVLAHEFLHAGLGHQERCQGRESYLWNIACDYVVNGWLMEMNIGQMPEGLLFDKDLQNKSVEEIYDMLLLDIRKYQKLSTFRGYGKGDIIWGREHSAWNPDNCGKGIPYGITMDEFCRNVLSQSLEYHQELGRGYIPAGLIEEIRALAMPPIPWDVELAQWFEEYFPYVEKKRSYARPSRRQGATPDIPRPRYIKDEASESGRTFGVIIDTSGSMSAKMIGMALGSIASYASVREVPYVRVVFCDAAAYDAGYLTPEEIAGRVEVKGRGGTRLQPGVNLLEEAKDFPEKGPVLIITDGMIESRMVIHREHAFLVPRGKRLPFRARGKVFYYYDRE